MTTATNPAIIRPRRSPRRRRRRLSRKRDYPCPRCRAREATPTRGQRSRPALSHSSRTGNCRRRASASSIAGELVPELERARSVGRLETTRCARAKATSTSQRYRDGRLLAVRDKAQAASGPTPMMNSPPRHSPTTDAKPPPGNPRPGSQTRSIQTVSGIPLADSRSVAVGGSTTVASFELMGSPAT